MFPVEGKLNSWYAPVMPIINLLHLSRKSILSALLLIFKLKARNTSLASPRCKTLSEEGAGDTVWEKGSLWFWLTFFFSFFFPLAPWWLQCVISTPRSLHLPWWMGGHLGGNFSSFPAELASDFLASSTPPPRQLPGQFGRHLSA